MTSIILKNSEIKLLEEGIISIHLNAYSEITINDALEIFEALKKLSKEKKCPVLIDAGEFCSINNEVRAFSASEERNIFTLAEAIAYTSLAQKMEALFYLKNNKPTVPTKIFPETKEAIIWLKTFLKKQI